MELFANLRDLGGLPLMDGGLSSSGVLYRSDAPWPGGSQPALAWPPTVVVDLRSEAERALLAYEWPTGTSVVCHDLFDAAQPGRILSHGSITLAYRAVLEHAAAMIAALPAIMAADGPTLIHCSAGKDRTGIAIASLLLAADVEPEAVIGDYELTASAMTAVGERLVSSGVYAMGRLAPEHLAAPREAAEVVVDTLTDHPDGAYGWLLAHGASRVDLDRFAARMHGA